MPKLIVLIVGADAAAAALAESAAQGARGVRFAEVDVRAFAAPSASDPRYSHLGSVELLRDYDGVVLAGSASSALAEGWDALLDELEQSPADAYVNTVFTVLGAGDTNALARVARLGGIVVSAPRGVGVGAAESGAQARGAGARAAHVVAWVRHALSHEQSDQKHHHSHEPA